MSRRRKHAVSVHANQATNRIMMSVKFLECTLQRWSHNAIFLKKRSGAIFIASRLYCKDFPTQALDNILDLPQ
nr:hypothetical protein Itr_chr15CG02660 [Ipomoea trifida]